MSVPRHLPLDTIWSRIDQWSKRNEGYGWGIGGILAKLKQQIEVIDAELKVTDYELKVVDAELKITFAELEVAEDDLEASRDDLEAAKDELEAAEDELKVAKDELKAAKAKHEARSEVEFRGPCDLKVENVGDGIKISLSMTEK